LAAACQKVPPAICEEIAFEAEFFPILAELVNITKDFGRCRTYFEKGGAGCIEPIVSYLGSQGRLAELLQISRIGNFRDAVADALGNDIIAGAFVYVTDQDADLQRAAHLLYDAARDPNLKRDEAAVLLSLSRMCIVASGVEPDFGQLVQNKFLILEIQARAGIVERLPFDQLITEFIGRRNFAAALCVYKSSEDERDDGANAAILAELLTAMAQIVLDQEGIVSLLVESNAAYNIPAGLEEALAVVVRNPQLQKALLENVEHAHEVVHSYHG
jgi:hypothetical protein